MDSTIFKKHLLPTYCWVIKFAQHKQIKPEMLRLVEKTRSRFYNNVSDTDWGIEEKYQEYGELFFESFREYIDTFISKYSKIDTLGGYEIDKCWFQKYEKGSYHGWHNHPGSDLSFVYFLELPENSTPTTIFLPESGEEYIPSGVEEGDVIVFPSNMYHKSSVNKSTEPKISIVFNLRFYHKE